MLAKSRDSQSHVSSPAEIVGYTLTGVLVVALVVLAVFFTFKKKKTKGDTYGGAFMPPPGTSFQVKSGKTLFSPFIFKHLYCDKIPINAADAAVFVVVCCIIVEIFEMSNDIGNQVLMDFTM